jgi:hypothetical protein
LIPNPIHKALLIVKSSSARFLVMGGQACILYGAAEFSRDLDLTIGLSGKNADLLKRALKELEAEQVYVPGFDVTALQRGHACHFRCHAPGVEGLRIDLMAKLRRCADFDDLWNRRTDVEIPEIGAIGLISLPDLVLAKKTQRDKDWPMIRRLVEANHLQFRANPSRELIRFWLLECRTPSLLVELAQEYHDQCNALFQQRDLLKAALQGDIRAVETALQREEQLEKAADRLYWAPLRAELERWRRKMRKT